MALLAHATTRWEKPPPPRSSRNAGLASTMGCHREQASGCPVRHRGCVRPVADRHHHQCYQPRPPGEFVETLHILR
eukprot:1159830-Pelagomonas_calceolata.AAC.5